MMGIGVNRVVLVGTVSQEGVSVSYAKTGTPCAMFTLAVTEMGQNGKAYTTEVPCELWGRNAEAAGECEAGQCVVFEGQLRKRATYGQGGTLMVRGFALTPIVSTSSPMGDSL
jgi:single-stranded DNA-binding protein